MSVKASLEENKDHILESLPTQELKDAFLKELDEFQESEPVSNEELVAQAQAPDHILPEMYEDVKVGVEEEVPGALSDEAEVKAAMEESLKNVPTEPNEDSGEE